MKNLIKQNIFDKFNQAKYIYRNLNKMANSNSSMTLNRNEKQVTFETLKFDNLTLRSLPIDTVEENYVREVRNACFSRVLLIEYITKYIS
jgi:hypothetical protein